MALWIVFVFGFWFFVGFVVAMSKTGNCLIIDVDFFEIFVCWRRNERLLPGMGSSIVIFEVIVEGISGD